MTSPLVFTKPDADVISHYRFNVDDIEKMVASGIEMIFTKQPNLKQLMYCYWLKSPILHSIIIKTPKSLFMPTLAFLKCGW